MRRLIRIVATTAILFGLMLPAQAYNPQNFLHPCTSHTSHTSKREIPGTGALYAEASTIGANRPTYFDVVSIVYFRPSIHHSNWTMVVKDIRRCSK